MRKFCCLLLLLALQAHAETYKWKDKNGNIQYGNNPPLGTKAEPVSAAAPSGNKNNAQSVISVNDVDALPYLSKNAEAGRKAYQEFLSAPPAKLFAACSNGKYFTIKKPASSYDALYKYMQKAEGYDTGLCHPYAFNDEVVWNRKK